MNRLIGFTPEGESYVFALHNLPYPTLEEAGLPINFQSEVTGPTFSPDGKTFYFNVQYPGTTFAVSGTIQGSQDRATGQDGCCLGTSGAGTSCVDGASCRRPPS